MDEAVGRGDVLLGVFPFAGEGATEEGLDQPAVDADTAGLAVSFAVTRRECDDVGCADGLALIRLELAYLSFWLDTPLTSWTTCLRSRRRRQGCCRAGCSILLKKFLVDVYGAKPLRMGRNWGR